MSATDICHIAVNHLCFIPLQVKKREKERKKKEAEELGDEVAK